MSGGANFTNEDLSLIDTLWKVASNGEREVIEKLLKAVKESVPKPPGNNSVQDVSASHDLVLAHAGGTSDDGSELGERDLTQVSASSAKFVNTPKFIFQRNVF